MDINELKEKLFAYKYVSFDVFDTLIFRTVSSPEKIHDLVSTVYNERYGHGISDYSSIRYNSEIELRRITTREEITLDDIFSMINVDKNILEKYKKIEMECEEQNCVPNIPMVKLAQWCKEQGHVIVITSDMYLPRSTFNRILEKNEIPYDYLFISAEENATKLTGNLYIKVLNVLNISPNEIIHIGDNPVSDIMKAKEKGIMAVERIVGSQNTIPYLTGRKNKDIHSDHFYEVLKYDLGCKTESPIERLGYAVLGPLLYNFCRWIHDCKVNNGIDTLLFVAREGYLIMNCYLEMYSQEKESIVYFKINKNLIRFPSLCCSPETSTFVKTIPGYPTLKWKEILAYLRVSCDDNSKRNFVEDIDELVVLEDLKSGLYDDVLGNIFKNQKSEFDKQSMLLSNYLLQMNLVGKKIGLVNNSMNGSTQQLLEDYIKKNELPIDILGLQFVKNSTCEKRLGKRSVGWINEFSSRPSYKLLWSIRCLIFEHMCFKSEGTALYFEEKNGSVEVICERPRKEKLNHNDISMLQNCAMLFVRNYSKLMPIRFDFTSIEHYFRFVLFPYYDDAKFCSLLWDDDVYGDRPINDLHYEYTIKKLLKDDFPSSVSWPEGFFVAKYRRPIYSYIELTKLRIKDYMKVKLLNNKE